MAPEPDDRAWVERLIFGRNLARRFTQDSPVLPDVWLAFALAPGEPQELLLTPNMDPAGAHGAATPGLLRRELAARLKEERQRPGAWWRGGRRRKPPSAHLAHNQSTVLATLWFDEVVRVVLPMSQWWAERVRPTGYDAQVGHLDPAQEGRLARLLMNPDLSAEEVGLPPGRPKPSGDLLWTGRVGGTIALARRNPGRLKDLRGR